MTTAAQVEKLYKKLTSEELAGLAFEALARQDGIELDTVVGNVKTQVYKCKDWGYRWRLVGLTDLYKYYSMIYWKNRAYMAAVENFINEATFTTSLKPDLVAEYLGLFEAVLGKK